MPNVTLSGGPRNADVLSVDEPWPRDYLRVDDEAGGLATYTVDNPDGAGPYTATFVDQTLFNDYDDFVGIPIAEGPQGPSGPQGIPGETGPEGPQGESFNPRGEYDPFGAYEEFDYVTHGYDSYVCTVTFTSGIEPGVTVGWEANWQLVAAGIEGPQGIQGIQGIQGVPGSPLPVRETEVQTTAALAVGASESLNFDLAIGYRILKLETDVPARVRLYTTAAKRDLDTGRIVTTDPSGDHGCVLEVVTTSGLLELDLSPTPNGYSMEAVPSSLIPARITNMHVSSSAVEVTLTWQPQEA